jgi:hypothetical protein
VLGIFEIGLRELFALVGFESRSSWVARITGNNRHPASYPPKLIWAPLLCAHQL